MTIKINEKFTFWMIYKPQNPEDMEKIRKKILVYLSIKYI